MLTDDETDKNPLNELRPLFLLYLHVLRVEEASLADIGMLWYNESMNTNLHTERDAFNAFIDSRFGQTCGISRLEDALTEFRAYQRELAEAKAKVKEAKASSLRGESIELDIDELIQDVTDELAAEGIGN
jgi:hypothetical protein